MVSSDYVSVLPVDSKGKPITLADYVRSTLNEKNLSAKDVEMLSRGSEGHISESYVWRIKNGDIKNVSPKMLRFLARGLQVDENILVAIAMGKSLSSPDVMETQLLTLFRRLPAERQEDVMRITRCLHQAHAVREETAGEKKKTKLRRAS